MYADDTATNNREAIASQLPQRLFITRGNYMEDLSVSAVTVNEKPVVYYIVYKTTNIVTKLIYVGQHIQQETSAFDGYLGSGVLLLSAIKEFKKENFTREIIEFCSSRGHLGRRETYWIEALSATDRSIGYNLNKGGEGAGIISEETRRKLQEAQKGDKNHNYGKQKSNEIKIKMSLAQKGDKNHNYGKHHSAETKRKMSERHKGISTWNKGKHHSEETKIKMSSQQRKYEYTLSNEKDYWTFFNKKQKGSCIKLFLKENPIP